MSAGEHVDIAFSYRWMQPVLRFSLFSLVIARKFYIFMTGAGGISLNMVVEILEDKLSNGMMRFKGVILSILV